MVATIEVKCYQKNSSTQNVKQHGMFFKKL